MTKTRFFRIYRIVLAVVLVGMLIPTLALSPYARPIRDDVWQPLPVARTWRETGSVLQTVKCAVQEVVNIYHDYSGIFFGMFLMVLPFSVFGNQFLFLNVILTVLLLVCAMWRLAWCAKYICKDVPKEVLHCFALLLSVLALLLMPSYYEAFYWYSASVNYVGIFSVSIFLFSALFRGVATGEMPVWKLVLLCVGFFLMGGGNWNSCTSAIVIYGGFALAILFLRKPRRLLIPYLFLVAGYMVNVFSPGNATRASWGGTAGLVESLINAFLGAIRFVFSDMRIWIFVILLLPVLYELCRRSKLSFRLPMLAPVYSLCVLASAFFPIYYSNYTFADRHINLFFLLLISLLVWTLIYVLGWLTKRVIQPVRRWPNWHRSVAGVMCAAVLTIGAASFGSYKLFSCSLQPVQAMIYWMDGHSSYWADYYDWMMEMTIASPDEEVQIPAYRVVNDRMMCPYEVVTEDASNWLNEYFAKYYGGDNCTIRIVP